MTLPCVRRRKSKASPAVPHWPAARAARPPLPIATIAYRRPRLGLWCRRTHTLVRTGTPTVWPQPRGVRSRRPRMTQPSRSPIIWSSGSCTRMARPGIPPARPIRRSLASEAWIAALKSRCASGLCRRIRTSLVNGRAFSWPPSNLIRRHAPYHPSRCFPLSLAWSPSTGTARPLPARRWSLTSTISRWARASMRLECRSSAPPSRGRAITPSPV